MLVQPRSNDIHPSIRMARIIHNTTTRVLSPFQHRHNLHVYCMRELDKQPWQKQILVMLDDLDCPVNDDHGVQRKRMH